MFLHKQLPCPALQSYIEQIWVFESSTGIPPGDLALIVPNGMLKMIIPYKSAISSSRIGFADTHRESSIILIGQMDTPATIVSEGNCGSIGIEFKPFAAYRFFQVAMHELTNKVLTLETILGKAGRQLQEVVANETKVHRKIALTEQFLLRQLQVLNKEDVIVDYAAQQIFTNNGLITMEELSRKLGYTRRYLDIRFAQCMGLNPKTLAAVSRFQLFYKAYNQREVIHFFGKDLYDYYYDQSHFIKEFKRFTGFSPTRYARQDNAFGRIFYKS
ncbi:AraC family transcriptional regulator [Chitinophaga sp. MM2321]|uniref:AraC family transcriptional regulator n=1 Tax=Chitinophaga sp. MM2321 TaxID=3137178 RepID=UPI0032D57BD6